MSQRSNNFNFSRPDRGFTLLELLVALAIFALLSVLSYSGLSTVLNTERVLNDEMDRLTEIQRSMAIISRDFRQAIDRPIRDEFGDVQPAFSGSSLNITSDTPIVELTRTGYSNPLGIKRSAIQRIAYRFEDNVLLRESWRVLDRAQDSQPDSIQICENIDAIEIRYLDHEQNWHDQWPPEDIDYQGPQLPLAVEINLELTDWGDIARLVAISEVV